MLKILYMPALSNSFPLRGYEIFNRLAKKHKVYLLHSTNYIQSINQIGQVNIHKIPVKLPFNAGDKFTPRSRFTFYTLNIVPYLRTAIQVIKKYQINVVVYVDLLIGAGINYIAKRLGIKCIFDCADYMPSFIGNYLPKKFFLNRIGDTMGVIINEYLNANSDLIVTIGASLKHTMSREKKNIVIIPNGADSKKFHTNMDEDIFRKNNNIPNDCFVFMFLGSLGFWVNLDVALKAFTLFHKKHDNTRFIVVGPDPKYCLDKFKKIGTDGISYIGRIQYERVPECLAAADVCILPFKLSLVTHAGIPVKMQEYAASKKPVISTPLHDIKKYYGNSVLFANSINQFQQSYEYYYNNPEIMENDGKKLYQIFIKYFDWNILALKYENILLNVCR